MRLVFLKSQDGFLSIPDPVGNLFLEGVNFHKKQIGRSGIISDYQEQDG
jgi:hypothetical protein